MKNLTELTEERAALLDQIDDILRTAQEAERHLTDEERTQVDELEAKIEGDGGLDEAIRAIKIETADADRLARQEVRRTSAAPMINIAPAPAHADRDLNELLWATNEIGRAANGTAEIPIEQVVVRAAVNDPGTVAPRLNAFQPEHRQLVRTFQEKVAEMSLVGMMVDEDANTSRKGFEVARTLPQFQDDWKQLMRAMDVDTSGEGGTWVPTGIGASLHEQVRVSGRVAPLFARVNIPTNPWKWPIEGSDLTAYRVAEPTSDTATKVTASTAGTVAATFDAEIFGARTLWSHSLDADSAIAIAPYMQQKLVQAFVDAEETAIINGDSDGTHQDSDIGASTTAAQTAWDGLRKKALAQTATNTNATTTVANLHALRSSMGKWGVNPRNLAFIIGVTAFGNLITDSNLLTVDKFGPNATILNGQVGEIFGVPVIVSEHVREDVNASGVYDGITTNESFNLVVNRNEFAIGQRMAFDVKTSDELYMETFQRVAVAFMREDFQHIGSAAANDDVAIGYGIA